MLVKFTLFSAITLVSYALPTRNHGALLSRSTSTSNAPLPFQSPSFLPSFKFNGAKPMSPVPTGPITEKCSLDTSSYPEPWEEPDVNHPEVQRAIKAIDWSYVPNFSPRYEGMAYDEHVDDACWWSKSLCTKPKAKYLPSDVEFCRNEGDFGLTYDDGPLNSGDQWAEPRLYDFLASHKQTATLFYIGSNVINFPEAAVRALNSGHTLSAHTWSHPQMTYQTNDQIVAQLYWSIRSIKEATGVTVTSWRPPFGDVDDRVRAIAHQMGLRTIIWDKDSFDWGLPSPANDFQGKRTNEEIDGYFEEWISDRKSGVDTIHGHIGLQHETSGVTVAVAERWLPQLQSVFNVKSVHDCAPELQSPYWET